jgi:hypothetical protein
MSTMPDLVGGPAGTIELRHGAAVDQGVSEGSPLCDTDGRDRLIVTAEFLTRLPRQACFAIPA